MNRIEKGLKRGKVHFYLMNLSRTLVMNLWIVYLTRYIVPLSSDLFICFRVRLTSKKFRPSPLDTILAHCVHSTRTTRVIQGL
jgi:hypothetical protein